MAERRHDALQRYLESQSDRRAALELRRDMAADPELRLEVERWRRLAAVVSDDTGRRQAAAALPPVAGLLEAVHAAGAAGSAGSAVVGAGASLGPIAAAAIIVAALAFGVLAPNVLKHQNELDSDPSAIDADPGFGTSSRPTPIARLSRMSGLESVTATGSGARPGGDRDLFGSRGQGSDDTEESSEAARAGADSALGAEASLLAAAPASSLTQRPLDSGTGDQGRIVGSPTDPSPGSPGGSGGGSGGGSEDGRGSAGGGGSGGGGGGGRGPEMPPAPGPTETSGPSDPSPSPTASPTVVPPRPAVSGISGTIVRRDGRSTDGIELTLWAHRDGSAETISVATTLDERGGYAISLAAGSWWVRVDANDARPAWADGSGGGGALSPIGRTSIAVEPDAITTGVDIVLDAMPGGLARGLVVRADGGPAGHILVSARADGTGPWLSALTGADGVFELPLEPGAFALGVSDSLSGSPDLWIGIDGTLGTAPTLLDLSALDELTLTLP